MVTSKLEIVLIRLYLTDLMKNFKIMYFVTFCLSHLFCMALTSKHQYFKWIIEKSKSMLFLKFLYSIQPVSAKFYRIYPDYFHQTGYFSHRPKSTKSLKVWRAKGLGKNYVYIFLFHFLIYHPSLFFIAHLWCRLNLGQSFF